MIVNIETKFKCSYETVVEKVGMSETLDFIAKPLIVFSPTEPENYPKVWENGDYQVSMKILDIIPFGKQFIRIEKVKVNDTNEFILRDNGVGDVIKRWDHWIFIKKTSEDNITEYIDRIDIKAGFITIFVWIYANIFYRWRQYRWKKLIKNNFLQLD